MLDRPAHARPGLRAVLDDAYRRCSWNFSLQRAVEWAGASWANRWSILEALRCGYPWASDRIHQFMIQGMADNAAALGRKRVLYYPYVEPAADAGKGLLAALAARSAVVISDDFPCFFLPRMYRCCRPTDPSAIRIGGFQRHPPAARRAQGLCAGGGLPPIPAEEPA